jgi:hypothetical protein
LCSASFIFHVLAVCEVIWGNMVETDRQAGRSQMVIWRMRIACWLTKATDTHSEYVILIALPLQEKLRVQCYIIRTVLHYTYSVTVYVQCYIIRTVLHYTYSVTLYVHCQSCWMLKAMIQEVTTAPCTIFVLTCTVVLTCVCNVWVCVCVCVCMCMCFGNMCICIYCVLYCFVYVYLFFFVLSVLV